jgi:hypothetical protein
VAQLLPVQLQGLVKGFIEELLTAYEEVFHVPPLQSVDEHIGCLPLNEVVRQPDKAQWANCSMAAENFCRDLSLKWSMALSCGW